MLLLLSLLNMLEIPLTRPIYYILRTAVDDARIISELLCHHRGKSSRTEREKDRIFQIWG